MRSDCGISVMVGSMHFHHFFIARNGRLIACLAVTPGIKLAPDGKEQPLDGRAGFFGELDP